MLALAIDTSGDLASITLARENALVAELTFRHKMDLLRRLMPCVDDLIKDAGVEKSAIEGVVVSVGPGSFTGLRIGVAAAKSIAYGLGRPLAGVHTLDVLAHGAPASSGLVVPLMHARPGEVYCAIYRKSADGTLERLSPDRALAVEDLVEEIKGMSESSVVFCGDGSLRNRDAIQTQIDGAVFSPSWFNSPRGSVLAALGLGRLLRGEVDDPLTLVPHYVKRSTPEIRAEQMNAKSQ
jgi:tRNA threonylcarbamoyladenosine biosynthesis protein TsaB